MCTIGERIKQQRKKIGLTQPQVRELTGISSGTLSDIENGKTLPAALSLLKLSKALECTVDWILTGKQTQSADYIPKDCRESELLAGFRELPEDEKEELLQILEMKRRKAQKTKKPAAKSSGMNNTEKDDIAG